MIGHVHASQARPHRSERGAVLVELAFIGMVLVVLIAGTFDYGLAWRSGLTANEAVRTGARVGSSQSLSPGADYYALNGLRASLVSSGEEDSVVRVVVFRSTTADGRVPTSCTSSTPSGTCNVLTGEQLMAITVSSFNLTIDDDPAVAPTGTGCLSTSAALHAGWCPTNRTNNQDTGSDYYGMHVELRYQHQFQALGSETTVRRTAVMRLEPTYG